MTIDERPISGLGRNQIIAKLEFAQLQLDQKNKQYDKLKSAVDRFVGQASLISMLDESVQDAEMKKALAELIYAARPTGDSQVVDKVG